MAEKNVVEKIDDALKGKGKEMPTYGVQPTVDETIPFEKFSPETGGYKLTEVDTESGKTAYKYTPATETRFGINKTQGGLKLPQTEKPAWNIIKHIETDTSVPTYLEDGVTYNPEKKYATIIMDRYGQHIQFTGTKLQNRERASTWDFVHQDLEDSDFPRQKFTTYGPDPDDDQDAGLPFIPGEREKGKGNPMDYRIGERRKNTVDEQLSEAFDPDNLRKRSIQIETRGDIRGTETSTGKYRYQKNVYFPSLVKRFAQDLAGPFVDIYNVAVLGASNIPKVLGFVAEGGEFIFDAAYKGVGETISSKKMFDSSKDSQELRSDQEYGISQYLFQATEWTKENVYNRQPTSYSIFASTFAQPTQEEINRGISAWREQDLRTFFENPNQSSLGKIAVELGIGYGFMKGINKVLKTIPKGVKTYDKYLKLGKQKFFDDLDVQRMEALSKKEGAGFTIPKTLKQKEKAWEELNQIQKDSYAKTSLSNELLTIAKEEGSLFFSKSGKIGRSYRYFTENMRFENGRKLLLDAPGFTVRNPRNIFRDGKDAKNIKVKVFDSYFASEEFHANTAASIGAVAMGEFFVKLDLNETAGYLFGAVSFAFGGTAAYNRRYMVTPTDFGMLGMGMPFTNLIKQGVIKGDTKYLDSVKYNDGDTVRPLNPYEKRQLGYVIDTIRGMNPERQAKVLKGFDAYQDLIGKLEAQGGDSSKLALKIAQVADLSTLRAIQQDLIDKINLGVGVNANIAKLQGQLDQEQEFFTELSNLTKKVLKGKTISALGKETDEALKNMDTYYTNEMRSLNEQYNDIGNVNKIFMALGDAAEYKNQGFTESYDDLFNRQNTNVKLQVMQVLKLNNIDADDPRAPELIRAEHTKMITKQNEDFDRWSNDGLSEFKVNPASIDIEAKDLVAASEKRSHQIRSAGDLLYAPIIAKLDKAGTMDITNWVDNFILSSDSLFDVSKLPANRIIGKTLPNDFEYLIPQILGEELGVQIDDMLYAIAKESGETDIKAVRNSIKTEYGIDPTDGLKFYKWIKKGGKEAEEFLSKHSEALGEDYKFDKIEVSAQSLVNIRRKLSGHKSHLKQRVDNSPLSADKTSLNNSIEILNAFDVQFDTLFSSSYGEGAGKLLQEFKEVSTEWSSTLAPLTYNEFSYDLARYGRTRPKGEVGEYGTNRDYGSQSVGKYPNEWGDYIIDLVHSGDIGNIKKAGRMLNEKFGQKIILKDGSTVFKIVDPTQQKNVAKYIESAIERKSTQMGNDYFRLTQLKTERGVIDLDPKLLQMVKGEKYLQNELMIPEGASYTLITAPNSPVQYTTRTNVYDAGGSAAFIKRMQTLIKDSPEGKNIIRAADSNWKRSELEVASRIDSIKLDIEEQTNILKGFFQGEGISYKPGSFNIKKAYGHFTEESTGSVLRIKKYKEYFFKANKASKKPLSKAAVEKEWKTHIRNVMVRGFLDNHTEMMKGSNSLKKVPNKKSIGDAGDAEDRWINDPDIKLNDDAGQHLLDYEDVFREALGDDQFSDLLDIITFSDIGKQGQASSGDKLKVMNIPTDMELRAIMSRVYGVVRNVVSKHWVATEFMIHSTRGQKGSLLAKILSSPEVTSFIADSLKNPRLITRDRITRINALMPKVFHEATVEDATYTDNPNYYDDIDLLNESGQPIRPGTMVPKNGVYGGMPTMNMGGKVSISQQMNNLNFRQ
tara:strand:+ start:4912 stop:9960 length:5049 start_codon:yes stop_codon:yes gene_type:complete